MDKINYDFFAGRAVNSFLYPLADRVNFLFRNILGYRVGTMGSYYILIVIFYQIKKFLKEMTKNVSEKLISIFSIFSCLIYPEVPIDNLFIVAFLLIFLNDLVSYQ